ncbi:hypothetical protein Syun_020959 [Stephania yunnanensis]|uniref:Uncharacterized protein n=1 Tax=Stephania yunnanensis TaxID=152371 RepID=A0AAP0IF58_9MAGN
MEVRRTIVTTNGSHHLGEVTKHLKLISDVEKDQYQSSLSAAKLRLRGDDLDLFIGPPPPAIVAEAESANKAEHFDEATKFKNDLMAGLTLASLSIPQVQTKTKFPILRFSPVSVSGYRVDRIIELAHQRPSTILIGGLTCVFISVGVCPVWAGEDLHNLVATNLEKLGEFLQGFGDEFFESKENDHKSDEIVSKDDKSFLQRYKSVMNSKTSEESFPDHGGFKFRHPWNDALQ